MNIKQRPQSPHCRRWMPKCEGLKLGLCGPSPPTARTTAQKRDLPNKLTKNKGSTCHIQIGDHRFFIISRIEKVLDRK